MWTKEYRSHYVKKVKQRRKLMRQSGGILKIAAYILSAHEIFDDEVFDYLNRLYIEIDLCGPKSIMSSQTLEFHKGA